MNKPTKPNIIIPEAFAVDGVKTDFTADKLQNGFDRIQPDVLAGDNLNKLIDDTYKGLNYAMAGTDAVNLIQEDEVLTVKNGELVSSKQAGGWTPSLLQSFWCDHELDRMDMLRADTFSWQNGTTYSAVYNLLLEEYNNTASTSKTEGTVTFKSTPRGFKIADTTQEEAIINLYNSTGVAWYYILDTTNQRFKLPRTKYDFVGLRTSVGNYVEESLPNITGSLCSGSSTRGCFTAAKGLFSKGPVVTNFFTVTSDTSNQPAGYAYADASNCSSAYQEGAPVQQRATEMYLYFYVGEYSQSAIEQTAGLNAELFNGKADISAVDGKWIVANATVVSGATFKGGTAYTYDVSSVFPDSEKYEIIYQIIYIPSSANLNYHVVIDGVDVAWKQATSGGYLRSSGILPITQKQITLYSSEGGNMSNAGFVILAYRRIGTNE